MRGLPGPEKVMDTAEAAYAGVSTEPGVGGAVSAAVPVDGRG